MPRKLTIKEFILKAEEIHGNKYDYSKVEYVNAKTKVCIICPIHGEFWQTPDKHLQGHECTYCNSCNKLNTNIFINRSQKIHGDFYNYDYAVYNGYDKKLKLICPIHGEFWQTANSHLHGNGCPKCGQSGLEQRVMHILEDLNVKFEIQKTFDWLKYKHKLRLDFYLPEYNIAIECQGRQHFEPVVKFGGEKEFKKIKERDKIKKELCNKYLNSIYYINYNDIVIDVLYDIIRTNNK